VLRDAAGFALTDIRLTDHVEQTGLTVVDVAHDGDHRRTGLEVLFSAGVLAVGEVEAVEQLAVLVLRADDLHDVVHFAAEQLQRLVVDRLSCRDHLTEVEQRLHECCGVRIDLVREVRQRCAASETDGLTVAAWQPDAADCGSLHAFVLGALRPLRLTSTANCSAGTTECTCRCAALTGTATAAGTTAESTGRSCSTGSTCTSTGAGSARRRGIHRRRRPDDHRERHRDDPDVRRHRARDERNEQALHPGSGEEAWSRGWDGVRPDLQADEVHPGREPDGDRPDPEPDEVHPGREPDGDRPDPEPDENRPGLRPDAVRREPDEVPDARRVPRSTGCYRREVPSVPDAVRRALRRWTVPPEPRGLPVPMLREQPEPGVPAVPASER
jgi:hypothetical protein